ncbi:MAG: hypothetical protein ACP5LP_02305 [Candidatus Micrarchaeia archaeon]
MKKEESDESSNTKKNVLQPTYKIVNIVARASLNTDLDLVGLARMSRDVDYEPEQFPGAIYKLHDPKSTILLFKNGKIICTGTKDKADLERAVSYVVDLVNKYNSSRKK